MNDDRIWNFEKSLWTASDEVYESRIADDCVMVVPTDEGLLKGKEAIESVTGTPRWDTVSFTDTLVARPQEGLIVVGYEVDAKRSDVQFKARCTSTYRRIAHENWEVVQHQQTRL